MAIGQQAAPFRLSIASVLKIQDYLKHILEYHKRTSNEIRAKLENIDVAYARYKVLEQQTTVSGTDTNVQQLTNQRTGITDKEITVPVVISQVDSFVGYLADVYLSGYPIFPVVSEPDSEKEAMMLETIIDNHALMGMYPRHFLMSFRDAIKYNFQPIEHVWEPMDQYNLVGDYLKPTTEAQLKQNTNYLTKIRRLDPYNTVWDKRVDPTQVCYMGEFAGYIDILPRIPLKQFINMYSKSGELYNIGEINAIQPGPGPGNFYYTDLPTITNMLSAPRGRNPLTDNFDWMAWLGQDVKDRQSRRLQSGSYERFTCYARIIPSEFGMSVPKANSPQIWKFILINGNTLLYARRIYTIYDALPVIIGQPLEDGFTLQTQSIAESQIPMQDAASTLFNIRFNAARRAVSDRALYDTSLISPDDANSSEPAAKIPVRLTGLNDKKLSDAYYPIPYESRGTETALVDTRMLLEMSDKLSGLNQPQQGRFQKGNKSVREWEDTMNNADNRPRLPALSIEFQVMVPLKEQIKLNIFQNGVQGSFQNFNTGDVYKVDPAALDSLRGKVLSFRIADGYTPKSKLASTDFLGKLIDSIAQIPALQQSWGAALPKMFSHLASLGGIRGLDKYLPAPAAGGQQQPPAGPVNTNVNQNINLKGTGVSGP